MKKRTVLWIAVAVAVVLSGVYIWSGGDKQTHGSGDKGGEGNPSHAPESISTSTVKAPVPSGAPISGTKSIDTPLGGDTNPKTPVGETSLDDSRLVDAFDALTDKWMKPAKGGVTMADVDAFAAQFGRVPKTRKAECLHRALNLIPDENVMLLTGILMDKSQDRELVELVYNDVLNRDEDVKKPILRQILKDREHPCWADTAWILDVMGERHGKK